MHPPCLHTHLRTWNDLKPPVAHSRMLVHCMRRATHPSHAYNLPQTELLTDSLSCSLAMHTHLYARDGLSPQVMHFECPKSDNAQAPSASTGGPEQVAVLLPAGNNNLACVCHQLHGHLQQQYNNTQQVEHALQGGIGGWRKNWSHGVHSQQLATSCKLTATWCKL
jgi:hypothetical protein